MIHTGTALGRERRRQNRDGRFLTFRTERDGGGSRMDALGKRLVGGPAQAYPIEDSGMGDADANHLQQGGQQVRVAGHRIDGSGRNRRPVQDCWGGVLVLRNPGAMSDGSVLQKRFAMISSDQQDRIQGKGRG